MFTALVLSCFASAGESGGLMQLPVHREYHRLRKEAKDVDRKLTDARGRMHDEIAQLNRVLYEARHAALMEQSAVPVPEGRRLGFDVLSCPRVNGSTSAHPLSVLTACRLLGAEYHWTQKSEKKAAYYLANRSDDWGFEGYEDERVLATYRLLAKTAEPQERLGRIINEAIAVHGGTHAGYTSLIEGSADLALVARKPSEDEQTLSREKGVPLDTSPVALDAFVFIVSRTNQLPGLTADQIKGIYTGRISDWAQVGGGEGEITPYQRNRNSGSQELMETVFMQGTQLTAVEEGSAGRIIQTDMRGPYLALTEDFQGIAYSVFFYEHFMAASPYTRPLGVDGVVPSYETISSGEYPYVTEVYVVIRKEEPAGSRARKLRDWLLTKEGQAVVRESGYVPLPGK